MLSFAVEHKAACNVMTGNVDNSLRAYEMTTKEWGFAEELRDVLKVRRMTSKVVTIWLLPSGECWLIAHSIQVFKDATIFFSRSSPNLATVIPAMDYIDEVLTTQSLNEAKSTLR